MQRLELLVSPEACFVDRKRQAYWNRRNSQKWAMAPTHLIESGQMNDEIYTVGCAKFYMNASRFMVEELDRCMSDLGRLVYERMNIWIIGAGHGDDLGFVPYARNHTFDLRIADHSKIALQTVLPRLHSMLGPDEPVEDYFRLADMRYIAEFELDANADAMVYSSRTLHHNTVSKQKAFCVSVGKYLRHPDDKLRIVIINPNVQDNEQWIEKWKSVNPFDTEDLLNPISEGAGHQARIARTHSWEVFGEIFTAATIML